jgi:thiol-disulfide isomerase/thioredoxin
MKKQIEKWKKKSLFSKITDIIFIILIVSLLIPNSRTAIMAFVNNIKAKIIQPKIKDESIVLSEQDYNWQLSDLKGNTINFSEFQDKVVFINFWATWCGPCVGEMPEIQKFYDNFKNNENVIFLIVSNEDKAVIQNFIDNKGYTFPVYTSMSNPPRAFDSNSIPTSFLISKSGKIVMRQVGVANWGGEKIQKTVTKLTKE